MTASDGELESIAQTFVADSQELLHQIEIDILQLEKTPQDGELIRRIFRSLHGMKGSAGFLGYTVVRQICHAAETLMGQLRSQQLTLQPGMLSALLQATDGLRLVLTTPPELAMERHQDLLEQCLQALQVDRLADGQSWLFDDALLHGRQLAPQPMVQVPQSPSPTAVPKHDFEPREEESQVDIQDKLPGAFSLAFGGAEYGTLRVSVQQLDHLRQVVGELVLTRNQWKASTLSPSPALHALERHYTPHHLQPTQDRSVEHRLGFLMDELYRSILQLRMQPVGRLWVQYPRMIHEIAQATGKQVNVTIQGSEIEVDGRLLEPLQLVMTHLLSNAVEHGIEDQETRLTHHKPQAGTLRLSALYVDGLVGLTIEDDGAGFDVDHIRQRALQMGLYTEAELAAYSHDQLMALVFHPGLSTASKISPWSGRGVGMDVIKEQLEKVGGSIQITSTRHVGTKVSIRLPLVISLLPAIVAHVGGTSVVIPQEHVVELLRFSHFTPVSLDTHQQTPHTIYGRLRDQVLPLFCLGQYLQWPPIHQSQAYVLLLHCQGRVCGLVVDQIRSTESVVRQPLPVLLQHLAIFDGMTLLENGHVAFSLHTPHVVQSYGIEAPTSQGQSPDPIAAMRWIGDVNQLWIELLDRHNILLPLTLIGRIEKLPLALLGIHEQQMFLRYEHRLFPVLRLPNPLLFQEYLRHSEQSMGLFVFVHLEGKEYVLWVNNVIDVVHIDGDGTLKERMLPLVDGIAKRFNAQQLLHYRPEQVE